MWYSIENLQNVQELIDNYECLHHSNLEPQRDIAKRPRSRSRKNTILATEQPTEQPIKQLIKHRDRLLKKILSVIAKFTGIFKKKTD